MIYLLATLFLSSAAPAEWPVLWPVLTPAVAPFPPLPPRPLPIPLPTPRTALFAEGQRLGVLSLRTGKQHPVLQAMAEEHAAYQARVRTQGHQRWAERYAQLQRVMPGYGGFREVSNESWPGQSEPEAAAEMFRSWRLSAGHWSVVNGRCDAWGLAMSRGNNGTWYACQIVANRR